MRRTKSRITIINPHILTDHILIRIQQRINNTLFVFVHHFGTILIKIEKNLMLVEALKLPHTIIYSLKYTVHIIIIEVLPLTN